MTFPSSDVQRDPEVVNNPLPEEPHVQEHQAPPLPASSPQQETSKTNASNTKENSKQHSEQSILQFLPSSLQTAGSRLLQYIEQRLGITYNLKGNFKGHSGNVIDFLRDALLTTKHQPTGLEWLYFLIPDTLIKNPKRKKHMLFKSSLKHNKLSPPQKNDN